MNDDEVMLDPRLDVAQEGDPDDLIEVVVRLRRPGLVPEGLTVVGDFGEVVTGRIRRGDIRRVHDDGDVESMKTAEPLAPEPAEFDSPSGVEAGDGAWVSESLEEGDERRPAHDAATGRGSIVAIVDWWFDLAHASLRNRDGSTRVLAFWDQRDVRGVGDRPARYGYGRVLNRSTIDRALTAPDPYAALNYRPWDGDPGAEGTHGTHVAGIAAGSAHVAPAGVAPEADILLVHLGDHARSPESPLGSSVTLLEAIDWIVRTAGARPFVISLSMGRHADAHLGRSLVEQALDAVVTGGPGRFCCQSAGNYQAARVHSSVTLDPGSERSVRWDVPTSDPTPNELEVWYPGRDVIEVELRAPDGRRARAAPGERATIGTGANEIARVVHRRDRDPNTGSGNAVCFLQRSAPAGTWTVTLFGADIVDGRCHMWIERDAPTGQSRFADADATPSTTTGSIANGFHTLAVGAYDAHAADRPLGRFSSVGPTVDGRRKPVVVAPGVRVLAARSAAAGATHGGAELTRKSGTSMAAPHAAGLVALMYQAAGRPLAAREIRHLLVQAADDPPAGVSEPARYGSGYINMDHALEATRAWPRPPTPARRHEDVPVPAPVPGEGRTVDLEELETVARAVRDPARLVADVMFAGNGESAEGDPEMDFELVARPGETLPGDVSARDLLVRWARGESAASSLAVVTSPQMWSDTELRERVPDAVVAPGEYVSALVPGDEAAPRQVLPVRVLTAEGVLPSDSLLLRPRSRSGGGEATELAPTAPEAPPASENGGGHAAPSPVFTLHVDASRDGSVDSHAGTSTTWTWGAAGHGAIALVNNDDDGINGAPDNADARVDVAGDASDLAPLRIERAGSPPAGTQLDLIIDRPDCLRIFASRTAGGAEIVGPSAGATHRFASLTPRRWDLGMEALRYAGTGFDGQVTITLRTTDAAGTQTDQTAVVRVAPWIVPNHLTHAETVYVVDTGSDNARFRADLRPMVRAAGCRLVEWREPDDRWMQDCMEFGFASLPGTALRTVMRSAQVRPLSPFPRSLLGTNLGYVEVGTTSPSETFDSMGNLDSTPPFTSRAGKRFPFGRVYHGHGRGGRAGLFEVIDPEVEEFLRRQVVQQPIVLDTGWLTVGHVDEVLSFVPAPGGKGFKMLIASPRQAYRILDSLVVANAGATILRGRALPDMTHPSTPTAFNVEQTISAFLALNTDFHPELRANIARHWVTHTPRPLRDFNTDRQAEIDGIRRAMMTELGLVDSDVIEIPAVLMPNPAAPDFADALIPGMVNMLVVNGHCIVPKPFGPETGTPRAVDRFEKDVRDHLVAQGLTVHFLDCWNEYHVLLGEVHCGTNTLRRATAARWWEFQP